MENVEYNFFARPFIFKKIKFANVQSNGSLREIILFSNISPEPDDIENKIARFALNLLVINFQTFDNNSKKKKRKNKINSFAIYGPSCIFERDYRNEIHSFLLDSLNFCSRNVTYSRRLWPDIHSPASSMHPIVSVKLASSLTLYNIHAEDLA